MLRNTLIFFDNKGDNLNLRFDIVKDCWVGTLFFPRTSIDLIALKQLFIFSEGKYLSEDKLVKPLSRFDLNLNLEFLDLEDSDNEDFYFYTKESESKYINLSKTQSTPLSSSNFTFNYEENSANIIKLEEDPYIFSVIYKPKFKKNSSTILRISYYDEELKTDVKLLELFLYGESEEEDDRFPIVMNNLGLDLDITNDPQVFKNVNPKEPLNDWDVINNKRKELLFSYDQIIPFTGTYKAIINAIKYYGYDNIKIKEWWQNLNPDSEFYGKYKSILIEDQPPESNFWKKTGLFTLVYQMNRVDYGNLDSRGLPQITEEFDFSSEEILNKLTLLRDKLQRHHTPIFSKIVDVVGEISFFNRLNLNIWLTDTRISYIKDKSVDFEIDIDYNYIGDLRTFNETPEWLDMSYNGDISGDYFLGQLKNFNINDISFIHDTPETIVGSSFNFSLNLAPKFKDLSNYKLSKLNNFKIEDLKYLFYHTIRWSVFNSKNDRVFYQEGDIRDLSTIRVDLDIEDIYSVKVEVIDRYNHILNRVKRNSIDLRMKEAEFTAFYEHSPDKTRIKDFKGRRFNSMNFPFKSALLDEDRVKFGDLRVRLKNIRKLQYWKTGAFKPLEISKINVPIKEISNKKIKFFNHRIPLNPHFNILTVNNGDSFTIDGKELIFSGLNPNNDYETIAILWNDFFKDSGWVANPIKNNSNQWVELLITYRFKQPINLDNFSWSNGIKLKPLPMTNKYYKSDNPFTVKFIDVKDGDYYLDNVNGYVDLYEESLNQGSDTFDVDFNSDTNINVYFSANTKWSLISDKSGFIKNYDLLDFRINNLKWFEFNSNINRYTRVYFTIDKTKIKGIKNIKWVLEKSNSVLVKEISNVDNFHHLFIDKGIYNLKLEVEDNKGNKKEILKRELIKVV